MDGLSVPIDHQPDTDASGSSRRAAQIDSQTGVVSSSRSATYSATEMYGELAANGGIVATAHNSTGRPLSPDQITEESIVFVGGREVSVRSALGAGYLVRDSEGNLHEPGRSPNVAPTEDARRSSSDPGDEQEEEQPNQGPLPEDLEPTGNEEVESIIDEVAAAAPQQEVVETIMAAANGEDLPEQSFNRIADSMGMSRDEALTQYESIREAFTEQAGQAVHEATGLDPEVVFEWARENAKQDLAEAIRLQAVNRSTSGYREIAETYIRDLDKIDPDALLNATYPEGVRAVERSGRIVLETPRGPMDWATAVRAGIVTISQGGS